MAELTPTDIAGLLAAYEPVALSPSTYSSAAVLVPIHPVPTSGTLEVVLTRRADSLVDHSGQVSFPGGRTDADDVNAEATALREAFEELGIPPEAVSVLGRLDDLLTITGFHITPVVGLLRPGTEIVANPIEVARVFAVPLVHVLDRHRWEKQIHEWRGNQLSVWHFPFDGEDVWGATAMILRNFADVIWCGGGGK